MSRTWAYLDIDTMKQYSDRAQKMGLTEGELTKKLIHIFLNTNTETFQPKTCLKCQYYKIATSNAMIALKKLNEALTLVVPEYMIKEKK